MMLSLDSNESVRNKDELQIKETRAASLAPFTS